MIKKSKKVKKTSVKVKERLKKEGLRRKEG